MAEEFAVPDGHFEFTYRNISDPMPGTLKKISWYGLDAWEEWTTMGNGLNPKLFPEQEEPEE